MSFLLLISMMIITHQKFINLNRNILNDQFHYTQDSTSINLKNAHIQSVDPDTFSDNFNLEWLILANNKIRYLYPNIFSNLVHLRYLWLSNNQLNKLEVGLLNGLTNLKLLYLHSNFLTLIDEKGKVT